MRQASRTYVYLNRTLNDSFLRGLLGEACHFGDLRGRRRRLGLSRSRSRSLSLRGRRGSRGQVIRHRLLLS
jgi:hypothetical protein